MANLQKSGIEFKKSSGTEKVLCPKCAHTRKNKNEKSMYVNHDIDYFNCFNCGYSVKDLKSQFKKTYKKPEVVYKDLSPEVRNWFLKERKISETTLTTLNITAKDNHTVCFNYLKSQEVANIKYRTLKEKKFWLTSDAELIFYNYDLGISKNQTDTLIICEGEIDAATFVEIGKTNVVSVPNGATKGDAKLEYLDSSIAELDRFEWIIIATDNDEAGNSLAEELMRRLGKERCARLLYPANCKDANMILTTFGNEFTKDWLNDNLFVNCKTFPIEGIETFDDYSEEIDFLYENGYPDLTDLKFRLFNKRFSLPLDFGQLTTVTGAPGSGKSEFVDELICRMMVFQNWRVGIFTPEHNPMQYYFEKLAPKIVGKPFFEYKDENGNTVGRMTREEKEIAKKFLTENLSLITMEEDLTIDSLLEKGVALVKRHGIRVLVLDPWNCIEVAMEKSENETQYVNRVLSKITNFCKKTNVHVFLVAHPKKLYINKDGTIPLATMYDISGSAHFFNKTHNGLSVFRNEVNNTVEVHIQKVKFKFQGKLGMVEFKYDLPTGRYMETNDFKFDELIDYIYTDKPYQKDNEQQPIQQLHPF